MNEERSAFGALSHGALGELLTAPQHDALDRLCFHLKEEGSGLPNTGGIGITGGALPEGACLILSRERAEVTGALTPSPWCLGEMSPCDSCLHHQE